MWGTNSPGGNLTVQISLDQKQSIRYEIKTKGKLQAFGSLGMDTSLEDFTQGLVFISEEKTEEIYEAYCLPAGKKDSYENHYIQTKITFRKGGINLILEMRAYDNGAAFRYLIPGEHETVEIREESTDFCFLNDCKDVWLQELVATYEAPYLRSGWKHEMCGKRYGMPALMKCGHDGPWIMVNEAAVLNRSGDYCISHLLGTTEHRLQLEYALEENGLPMNVRLPFASPWRYLLVADTLDDVVNSTLNYNLNPPSEVEDISWIKPARALWQWWINDTGPQVYTEVMEYVDFAASMGFEAVLADAGWDGTWMERFCCYAHSKGISPWLWTAMIDVNTREKAEHLFHEWKSWGADGVKIDIIENDSAATAGWYKMTADIMAKEQLMVNYHGCTKPMGEGRTWPHFVAAEGIMGLEYYKWSDQPNAEHNCTVPFIRNVVGPMDYTPVGFTNKNRNTSMAHQMALAVVFESGYTHYAASIYNLEAWKGTDFLRRLKPRYDGLRLLSGYPGDHVTMLRWVKESEEFMIGCICNEKRTLSLKLDFLGEGEYEAEIYYDDRFGERVLCKQRKVRRETVLNIPMIQHGGAGIYISRSVQPLVNVCPDGYMSEDYYEIQANEARAIQGSSHGVISDEDSTQVLRLAGEAEFICKDRLTGGLESIRLFYRCQEDFLLRISDGMTTVCERIPASGEALVLSTYTVVFPFAEGPVNLMLERMQGGIPLIDKIRIIQNNPKRMRKIPMESALISGAGTITNDPWGGHQLIGAESGTKIRFNNIQVPDAGEYILGICYYAASTGTAVVSINDNERVSAKLSGVGKWNSTKEGDLIKREVIVKLKEGGNDIELVTDEPLPPLKELRVVKV